MDQGVSPVNHAQDARATSSSFRDRKSTRLNSSHGYISYAVFCLKKNSDRPVDVRRGKSDAHADDFGAIGPREAAIPLVKQRDAVDVQRRPKLPDHLTDELRAAHQ